MARKDVGARVNELFSEERWDDARALLREALGKEPKSHWLLTQLGVTYYEQRRYGEALRILLDSLEILDDCPLTLWHLAGTLDALGRSREALRIYSWIIDSDRSADDDPCWESREWTDSLKTDGVFRLAVCLRHLGKKKAAEECYRRYLDLRTTGVDSIYSSEDAIREIALLHEPTRSGARGGKRRDAFVSALQTAGIKRSNGKAPPKFIGKEPRPGRRVASKR
jgi:tetratricopeptide (TPR) repeat protein